MSAPTKYDPTSENEQAPPLPSAPRAQLDSHIVLQPPLTRRGTGPGLFLILPPLHTLNPSSRAKKPLDPEPVQKWAEEGFAVIGITPEAGGGGDAAQSLEFMTNSLTEGRKALLKLKELDQRDRFGVIVYDVNWFDAVVNAVKISQDPLFACLTVYGIPQDLESLPQPQLIHIPSSGLNELPSTPDNITFHRYNEATSPHFVLPQVAEYEPGSAAQAHSRTLVFLRKWLGGPIFDLEAIWEEHTYYEFALRSVAKTMATMVQEPYVNHVPTLAGGIGREALTAFYRDHFIFNNPADTKLVTVTRTVGPDRVIDEFVATLTHDKTIDWLLPSIPPTGKKLTIPAIAVVNVRGDRLYNEHIWWDQASALLQAGILPTHVPHPSGQGMLRLPVAGVEAADMLLDETNGTSNEMLDSKWATS
ncbi:hypothetical protein AX16_000152 [Volvariella volvacea WC 439]|nr:hypothetical protein AX16_000152 [Volvariella volvacea WC 439]